MEEEIKPKLSGVEIFFLVAFALIADLINWIPIINWVTTFITAGFFQFYFWIRGVKGAKWSLVGNIIELVPMLSILPAITAGVIATVLVDRGKAKLAQKQAQADSARAADLGYNYRELETEDDQEVAEGRPSSAEAPQGKQLLNTETSEFTHKNPAKQKEAEEQTEAPTFRKPVFPPRADQPMAENSRIEPEEKREALEPLNTNESVELLDESVENPRIKAFHERENDRRKLKMRQEKEIADLRVFYKKGMADNLYSPEELANRKASQEQTINNIIERHKKEAENLKMLQDRETANNFKF